MSTRPKSPITRPPDAGCAGSASDQATIATICEVSARQHVIWTMPRATYEVVATAMQNWPLVFGRTRPKPTVERVLELFAKGGWPNLREGVTRTVKPAGASKVCGHEPTVEFYDEMALDALPRKRLLHRLHVAKSSKRPS